MEQRRRRQKEFRLITRRLPLVCRPPPSKRGEQKEERKKADVVKAFPLIPSPASAARTRWGNEGRKRGKEGTKKGRV